jgi:hypothetical protein
MEIQEWTDPDYMTNITAAAQPMELPKNTSSERVQVYDMYLLRQRKFYMECMKAISLRQSQDPTAPRISHVAIIDSDEFVVANPNAYDEYNLYFNLRLNATKAPTTMTIWDMLQRVQEAQANETSLLSRRLLAPCIPMARLLFSTKEEVTQQSSSIHSFNTSHFLTLRYQHHFGLKNRNKNKKIKSIIDLSQIDNKDLHLHNIHAHRPLLNKCRKSDEWLGNRNSPIVAHHYVGSWEQWTFRDDPRFWTRKKQGKYEALRGGDRRENVATTWLDGFVQHHGVQRAQAMLKDVGYVPPKNTNESVDD